MLAGVSVFEREPHWIEQELDKIAERFDAGHSSLVRTRGVYSLTMEYMHSFWSWLTCLSPENFEHVVIGLASIVGGAWVVARLIHEKTWEAALAVEIKSSAVLVQGQTLTFIEVGLCNLGKVRLRAGTNRTGDGYAYEDKGDERKDAIEKLRHSGSLRLKKLTGIGEGDAWIDWFDKTLMEAVPEIDLLNEYENPEKHRPDFWMEPGETYKLGVPLRLSDGVYLAKVTFVGKKRGEFWSRIAMIRVPAVE